MKTTTHLHSILKSGKRRLALLRLRAGLARLLCWCSGTVLIITISLPSKTGVQEQLAEIALSILCAAIMITGLRLITQYPNNKQAAQAIDEAIGSTHLTRTLLELSRKETLNPTEQALLNQSQASIPSTLTAKIASAPWKSPLALAMGIACINLVVISQGNQLLPQWQFNTQIAQGNKQGASASNKKRKQQDHDDQIIRITQQLEQLTKPNNDNTPLPDAIQKALVQMQKQLRAKLGSKLSAEGGNEKKSKLLDEAADALQQLVDTIKQTPSDSLVGRELINQGIENTLDNLQRALANVAPRPTPINTSEIAHAPTKTTTPTKIPTSTSGTATKNAGNTSNTTGHKNNAKLQPFQRPVRTLSAAQWKSLDENQRKTLRRYFNKK